MTPLMTSTKRIDVSGKGGGSTKPPHRLLSSIDYLQLIPAMILLGVGLLYIYSTGHQKIGGNPDLWKKQLKYILLGACVWAFFARVNYKTWTQWALVAYSAAIVLLVFVLLFGTTRYGAKRWFSFYGLFSLQPSEFAKPAAIVFVAWLLSQRRFNPNNLKHIFGVALAMGTPFLLILIEPDLGSAVTLVPVAAAMIFVAGVKWKWVVVGIVVAMIMIPSAYPFLSDYQKERVLVFLDPARNPTGKGWNSRQSQLAVGSGGMWGKGFMKSTQSTLGFLPKTVANSDFIFSVIAEETGFVGSVSIIFCYFLLVFSAMRTAAISSDPFGRYLAVGIGTLVFIHSAVNIGMTIRLAPVTGLPLPLVSLGGTFIVSMMAALGILQSIYIHSRSDNTR